MNTYRFTLWIKTTALAALISFTAPLFAQDDPVLVRGVSFGQRVQPYQWNSVVVDLETRRNPSADAVSPDFLNNVTVRLTLGYDAVGRREERLFMQSEMTLMTVKDRENPSLVFFIPQQIGELYDLPSRGADYWLVEIEVGGQALELRREHTGNLASLEIVQNFKNAANQQLGQTEGYMMPWYLTPYSLEDIQRGVRTRANFNRYAPAVLRKEFR